MIVVVGAGAAGRTRRGTCASRIDSRRGGALFANEARATIRVRWSELDAPDGHRELTAASGLIAGVVARHLPKRLAEQLVVACGILVKMR
jgi:hypothetical protein